MLPKKRRISRSDFTHILANGRRFNSPHLLLYVVKNTESRPIIETKLSFSASKKVCSNAVGRNKLRRRGYSVIGRNISKIQPGFMCFFVFKKDSLSVGFKILENEILGLLSDAVMIK